MEKTLAEQIQEVIDSLQLAGSQAAKVKQTMREQHLSFGLEYNQLDDDIAQIMNRLRYLKRLAERRQ
jgi:TorA maturation chaperone TorD